MRKRKLLSQICRSIEKSASPLDLLRSPTARNVGRMLLPGAALERFVSAPRVGVSAGQWHDNLSQHLPPGSTMGLMAGLPLLARGGQALGNSRLAMRETPHIMAPSTWSPRGGVLGNTARLTSQGMQLPMRAMTNPGVLTGLGALGTLGAAANTAHNLNQGWRQQTDQFRGQMSNAITGMENTINRQRRDLNDIVGRVDPVTNQLLPPGAPRPQDRTNYGAL